MKELVVVAIGGNSIIKDNNGQSIEAQEKAVQEVASHVCDMLEGNYNIVLTHGNGPQVGLDLRRAEIAHTVEGLPLTPLANCVADTQGGIGYLIQQALTNALAKRHHRQAVTIVTQVEVDKNDPNFHSPTKPIGAFFSLEQAEKLKKPIPTGILLKILAEVTAVSSPHRRLRVLSNQRLFGRSVKITMLLLRLVAGGSLLLKIRMAVSRVSTPSLIKIYQPHC